MRSEAAGTRAGWGLRTAAGLGVAFLNLPLLFILLYALTTDDRSFTFPPPGLTLRWFAVAWNRPDVWQALWLSVQVAVAATLLALVLGVPAGYALARSRSRLAVGTAYFFLAIRMIPAVAALIPFYLLMRDIGLLGTWWAVILINTMLNCAFVTWMMFSYFRSLPPDMEEAAMTDGCTQFGAFWRVAVPSARSGMIASALFCIMFAWNDFLFAMFLTRTDAKPISVALLTAYGTQDITWGTLGALAHFSTIPIVLMALVLNRYFVQGATNGVQ